MTFSAHDGETKIIGSMIDPALLQSLFEQIAGLGLMLWRVVPLENQPMEEP